MNDDNGNDNEFVTDNECRSWKVEEYDVEYCDSDGGNDGDETDCDVDVPSDYLNVV